MFSRPPSIAQRLCVRIMASIAACLLAAWSAQPRTHAGEASRDGLILEYRFDGNAADSSGAKHDGTLAGHPRFVDGKTGPCLALDGQATYVDSGTNLANLGPAFTVECWVNPAGRQHRNADVFGNHGHGGVGFAVEQDGENTNRFYAAIGRGSGRWVVTRPVQLTAGAWQHIAIVKTPNELRFCLNGIPVAVARQSAAMLPSPNTLRVGDSINDPARCFHGRIDEFRVWNKAIAEFDLRLDPENKLQAFAQAARIRLHSPTPAPPSSSQQPAWRFTLDETFAPCVPREVSQIVLDLEAADWRSAKTSRLPAVTLLRESAFQAALAPPLPPGYYSVRYKASLMWGDRRFVGVTEELSGCVYGRTAAAAAVSSKQGSAAGIGKPTQVVSLDGPGWLIATDPKNEGRGERWFESPRPEAKTTRVPWVIQDVFPDYHGVAWYWREFASPVHFQPEGRYLLRFRAVDYLAEVWLNGVALGVHEGGETPFVLDATAAVRPGQTNRLAVRVLNPTYEPIDGIALKQTASGAKQYPVACNSVYNSGGIVDSVELVVAPAVRITDLCVVPDWKTGEIRVRASVCNAGQTPAIGRLRFAVAPAAGGETLAAEGAEQLLPPGETVVETRLTVANHRLWQLGDPYLYRVTARVQAVGQTAFDEQSVRCGFRDFRFADGYFRLNGRRIFLHGNIHLAQYPAGYTVPLDPDMFRRDVLNMKAAGINLCRIAFGGTIARQLDVFDELGVMVCQEHYGSWQLQDNPQLKRRYQRSLGEILLRDRSHPSIVAWGLLNEIGSGDPIFRIGVDSLDLVRWLDDSRMCILNSGRFDGDLTTPSLSNPGSHVWESDLQDIHGYPPVPHSAELLRSMRTSGTGDGLWSGMAAGIAFQGQGHPLFVSEYGQCGAVDLPRTLRHYEQQGKTQADDARYFRRQMDKFLADWQLWRLDRIWPRPEDFFLESDANLVKLHRIGINALRANPHLVAFSSTHAITEAAFQGASATNLFRELKPGLLDVTFELTAPLRWSLFAEPVNVYRGRSVRLEAVLVNEDKLRPGKYPARFRVIDPQSLPIWERTVTIEIPQRGEKQEPPFAQPVFAGDLPLNGPPGRYRFLATLLQGGAPQGGETELYVTDAAAMPGVAGEIALWGEDADVQRWLAANGIRARPFAASAPPGRTVILASGKPPAPGGAAAFAELAGHVAGGATAVLLAPSVFSDGQDPIRWLPLKGKGRYAPINWVGGYYRADMWAKNHPIFEGLPSGGILDPTFYREILPQHAFLRCYTVSRGFTEEESTADLDPPAEAVCGAHRLSANYASGLHVAVYRLGSGRWILNNLLVRENLGRTPVAERLLRNMLNFAAHDPG